MAVSFMQKIRLALRGWSRRRDEEAKRKEQEFLQRNVSWGKSESGGQAPPPAAPGSGVQRGPAFDLEGLQVAYLDDSGKIAHYLDRDSGEVVEVQEGQSRSEITANPTRYRKVPARSATSDDADRRDFAAALDPGPLREKLLRAADGAEFRRLLAGDRAAERAWYNFKNDRATAAIQEWLKRM